MKPFDPRVVRRNKRIFKDYTRLRRQYAYEVNAEKASVALEIIPVLLSLNEPDLPGYVTGGDSGCGVYGIGSSDRLREVVHDFFPELRKRRIRYQRYLVKRPIIESIFLMGSIGTIAQKYASDFDFWVCVDSTRFSREQIHKLRQKSAHVARWCESKFDMEVHFFIMDLDQIRKDDFGTVDEESTGSSQRKFLKEEFYRTMLLVAGKVPFWWVLPAGIEEEEYEQCWKRMVAENDYDFDDYVELGFLGHVPREEFLGTTLWQLSKGIKDPFKALIKMSMMERYLSESFEGPLLCDVLKERVLSGSTNLRDLDPYLLMIETVLDFYEQQKRTGHVELLRKAFYIKAEPKITRMRLKREGWSYQVKVFGELMKKWGWNLDMVEDLNQMENWSYARHLKFSQEINQFFFSTYRRLSKSLPVKDEQVIDDHDLTLLGRKLFVLFSHQDNKLMLTPFITEKRSILKKVIFQFAKDRAGGRIRWFLYDATKYASKGPRRKSRIFSSHRVVRAATWLVINGLYDFHATGIEMPSNPSGLNVNDLIELLKHLQSTFLPAVHQIKMGANLREDAKYDRIMMVVDMEELSDTGGPVMIDLILSNTWGEMFTEVYPYKEGLSFARDYIQALEVEDVRQLVDKVKVHVPKSGRETGLKKSIYGEIFKGVQKDWAKHVRDWPAALGF
ncbi:MAG: hypothetical protein DRH11_12545 [Deltaproteobacteria bacterium]|nr:MAG: hypothetical protein DRH11_12545 [Deltaproteobacteria bacterium]